MKFWKYQGAGNDFIMLDQRQQQWIKKNDRAQIEQLCHRRFGIGADGLILLQTLPGFDFEMIYFNSDGRESSMCGNGGRCIVAFAKDQGILREHYQFMAIDGKHEALIKPGMAPGEDWVELKMTDIQQVEKQGDSYILNTGSPHYVRFETNLDNLDMVAEGRAVRYSAPFKAAGINVNLVCKNTAAENGLKIRTYERGVEDETYACGTGVTAAAIASFFHENQSWGAHEVPVQAKGGQLSVRFNANSDGTFSDVWLCGPAAFVFEGTV